MRKRNNTTVYCDILDSMAGTDHGQIADDDKDQQNSHKKTISNDDGYQFDHDHKTLIYSKIPKPNMLNLMRVAISLEMETSQAQAYLTFGGRRRYGHVRQGGQLAIHADDCAVSVSIGSVKRTAWHSRRRTRQWQIGRLPLVVGVRIRTRRVVVVIVRDCDIADTVDGHQRWRRRRHRARRRPNWRTVCAERVQWQHGRQHVVRIRRSLDDGRHDPDTTAEAAQR